MKAINLSETFNPPLPLAAAGLLPPNDCVLQMEYSVYFNPPPSST
jgi:hypothetical protein